MRRILLLAVFATALPLFALAQTHGYSTNFMFSKHDFCDTIPIIIEDGQVYVDVLMNGGHHRFNLDTGSSQGMVYKGSHIGYWTELGNVVSRDANNRLDTVKVIALPPFTLGSLQVSGYVATVYPDNGVPRKYDAILGFDLFNKGLMAKIDARQSILIITDKPHFFDQESGHELRYKLKWFVPYVMVSPFMRHVDEALFDLGSRQLYRMNKQSFEEHAYKSKQVNAQVEQRVKGHISIGASGSEREDEVVFLKLDRLRWNDFDFRNLRVNTTQGPSAIGAAILDYGSVIINPFRKRIIFQPYENADSVSVNNKPAGLWFVSKDGLPAVGLIWEQTDAYKQGLRQGDIILRVNGKPILSFEQYLRYPFVSGRTYKFTIRDAKGQLKEINITRQ